MESFFPSLAKQKTLNLPIHSLQKIEECLKSRECVGFDVLNDDREWELNELMSSKAGVKGLVDSGICKVPRIFLLPAEAKHMEQPSSSAIKNQVPVIDLEGYQDGRRMNIVNEILQASRTWGIFQFVNHGVPLAVMKQMLESVAEFHEQPKELKEKYYSHYSTRKVWYYTTMHPVFRAALWKDTIACLLENMTTDFEALPIICRKPMSNYVRHIVELKGKLCKLLSQALGLKSDHLELMECMEARKLATLMDSKSFIRITG